MAGTTASPPALAAKVDWKDIGKRLSDPKQRRSIVTKTDTEELNRLKTKNAFLNRKRKLLDQILKLTNFYTPKPLPITKSSDKVDHPDSRCSELNFGNDDAPSTPPPTIGHNPSLGPGSRPIQASRESGSDSEIDMGDYENRVRPSSAFWRKPDGLSLAEKIIYYRNWKYRNVPKKGPANQPMDDEIETTLAEYRRGTMRSTRRPAKSAVVTSTRRGNPLPAGGPSDDTLPRRPVTVIPNVRRQRHDSAMFPPVDTRGHVLAKSSRDLRSDADDRLPAIDRNQYVTRKSPNIEENEMTSKDKEEEDTDQGQEKAEEETNVDSGGNAEKDGDQDPNKRKKRAPGPGRGPKGPRPNTEPDKLIRKLDKKVERDLKNLQGHDNDDDDDDDDSDVDEDTMNDLLFGEKSKELDRFLKS